MKKAMYLFAFIVALVCAAMILSPAVAGAEEFTRSAFVAHIDADDGIVYLVDGCGICWQHYVSKKENIYEYELLDLFTFTLCGEKVTKSHIKEDPVYSAIKVDREWAIHILFMNHPQFVDDLFNNQF